MKLSVKLKHRVPAFALPLELVSAQTLLVKLAMEVVLWATHC